MTLLKTLIEDVTTDLGRPVSVPWESGPRNTLVRAGQTAPPARFDTDFVNLPVILPVFLPLFLSVFFGLLITI